MKTLTKNETIANEPTANIVTPTSFTDRYIQRLTSRLLLTYETDPETQHKYNANIDAVFYSKSQWTKLLKDENNYLEKKWRTKMLVEATPRGNIVMFYDAYKLGFAYYADQTIPYSILNAVSMKYVLTFCCRDFFVDELVLPEKNISGITAKHNEDSAAEQAEQKRTESTGSKPWKFEYAIPEQTNLHSKSPFAKFKSYNSVSAKSTNPNTTNLAVLKQTNRFICLGKIRNATFLQKPGMVLDPPALTHKDKPSSPDLLPSVVANTIPTDIDRSFVFEDKSSTANPQTEFSTSAGALSQSGIYSIFSPTSNLTDMGYNEVRHEIDVSANARGVTGCNIFSYDGNPSTENPHTPLASTDASRTEFFTDGDTKLSLIPPTPEKFISLVPRSADTTIPYVYPVRRPSVDTTIQQKNSSAVSSGISQKQQKTFRPPPTPKHKLTYAEYKRLQQMSE